MKQWLRRVWRAVNPTWMRVRRQVERVGFRVRTLPDQWLRRNWPARSASDTATDLVSIVTVNYNTAEHLAHLLFSLFRILGRDHFREVVVVDNGSTDASPAILRAMQAAGLIHVILNSKQRYHGPALNQGMNYLAGCARRAHPKEPSVPYVWILDSDAIVLRPDAVPHSIIAARRERAALLGQFQFNATTAPHGYAHVSSLLVDPFQAWRRSIVPFEESGSPATGLHCSLRRHALVIADFPYMSRNYVLHLGQTTLSHIHAASEKHNPYFAWAQSYHSASFHGNPQGHAIYQQFLAVFAEEVGSLSPERLVSACLRNRLVSLTLPPLDQVLRAEASTRLIPPG